MGKGVGVENTVLCMRVCLVSLLLCSLLGVGSDSSAMPGEREEGPRIRRSLLQGSWYPAEPDALRARIRTFLSKAAPPPVQGRIRALVVPHAGYRYSGSVAAHAYRVIQGRPIRRVVLIGPSHRWGFDGVSVARHEAYETPLGRVQVDRSMADRLIASSPVIRFVPQAHAAEHSLEIQLPFLQTVLRDFSIVPVIMGRQDPATCSILAEALARLLEEEEGVLIIASTDLSHHHDDATARALDGAFIRYVESFDAEGLAEALETGRCEACGGGPAVTAMKASGKLGADRSVILDHATSGDVTGDRDRVVGYLAAAILE